MSRVRSVLRWIGIVVGIFILSMFGFAAALWLSPGDPGRVYLYLAGGLAAFTMLWRRLGGTQETPE